MAADGLRQMSLMPFQRGRTQSTPPQATRTVHSAFMPRSLERCSCAQSWAYFVGNFAPKKSSPENTPVPCTIHPHTHKHISVIAELTDYCTQATERADGPHPQSVGSRCGAAVGTLAMRDGHLAPHPAAAAVNAIISAGGPLESAANDTRVPTMVQQSRHDRPFTGTHVRALCLNLLPFGRGTVW